MIIYALSNEQRGRTKDLFLNFRVCLKVKHAKEMIESV